MDILEWTSIDDLKEQLVMISQPLYSIVRIKNSAPKLTEKTPDNSFQTIQTQQKYAEEASEKYC